MRASLQYLHCVSDGDPAVLHQATYMMITDIICDPIFVITYLLLPIIEHDPPSNNTVTDIEEIVSYFTINIVNADGLSKVESYLLPLYGVDTCWFNPYRACTW